MTVSITGTKADAGAILESRLLSHLANSGKGEISCAVRPWGRRREGIVIPADVSFAGLGGSLLAHGGRYGGAVRVFGRITGLSWLWNAIRVQGGAYGAGLVVGDSGNACFYSYRDPNAARSLDCYRQAADFVEQLCAADPDLTDFIIGAVAESDPLLLPHRRGEAADAFYLKGIRYEDRCQIRQEMLSVTPKVLRSLAEPLRALSEAGSICVIGSRRQIEDCKIDTVYTL